MQHHANARLARALATMCATPGSRHDETSCVQLRLHPGVAPAEIMLLAEMVEKVLHRPTRIVSAVLRKHPAHLVDRHPPGRRLAQSFVEQPCKPFLLVAPAVAPELPLRAAQDLARILPKVLSPSTGSTNQNFSILRSCSHV